MSEELVGLLGQSETLDERLRFARHTLGERLRMAREFMGLKQNEVAKHLSIRRSTLTSMETGRRKVGALELARLAELYQRPESWFTGEDAAGESAFPAMVSHVVRAAASLSTQDRRELARFADFLEARARNNLSRGG